MSESSVEWHENLRIILGISVEDISWGSGHHEIQLYNRFREHGIILVKDIFKLGYENFIGLKGIGKGTVWGVITAMIKMEPYLHHFHPELGNPWMHKHFFKAIKAIMDGKYNNSFFVPEDEWINVKWDPFYIYRKRKEDKNE